MRFCDLNSKRAKTRFSFILAALFAVFGGIWLFEYMDAAVLNYSLTQPSKAPQGEMRILIRISDRVLELYDDGKLFKRYRVAVGKQATPTPIGEWNIVYKGWSPREVMGTRWMGLDVPWGSYGIHGTSAPWSIGSFASHGCIRLRNQDSEELYEWVPVGTPVDIIGPKPRIDRVLRRGTQGPDVIVLQLRLVALGYYQERAKGTFGKETEAALRAFQRDNRLPESGITDKKTLELLRL
ncbi:L,D-transpeptidase family protein [Sporomusa acidovorans]|uniref:L,D-TPase catalytic domain-containing protein n=1 Tax=Sporomusa acidovorans (strain ATCC 49682 / DSM 3132 / Mol) TaxID=1123286 RepID=A0ABZ3IXL6_SPOA4|nr:L,D-transpeptidase family protein [Sporomusa acidovorans]OZC22229.1 putative L,D-transpeptidase YkuD [Sporomusa acidovorans DSM 3132]SDE81180.1 Putative peptidoglycan binding domain-containing protein [Sporomusa acidovorans]